MLISDSCERHVLLMHYLTVFISGYGERHTLLIVSSYSIIRHKVVLRESADVQTKVDLYPRTLNPRHGAIKAFLSKDVMWYCLHEMFSCKYFILNILFFLVPRCGAEAGHLSHRCTATAIISFHRCLLLAFSTFLTYLF